MTPAGILETVLYAKDLAAAEAFYRDALGMEPFAKAAGRHLFYRCGRPGAADLQSRCHQGAAGAGRAAGAAARHGGRGPRLLPRVGRASSRRGGAARGKGVAIEADFEWPGGGRSIYFRDPAGNCLEFAEPRIWKLA